MWSHYADGHKGIALHFDSHAAPFDTVFAVEVRYAERYPEYSLFDPEPVALYTKSTLWYYEEEYRVIRVVAEGKRPAGAHGHIERSPRSAGFGTAQANELMC
jgi:hypothetical protein